MTDKQKPNDLAAGVMRGLEALDTRLREAVHASAKGGEISAPGTGLHDLLSVVASQFLGLPVQGFPQEEAAPTSATGATGPHVEAGSLSAQALAAGSSAIEAGRGDEGQHADKPSDGSKSHRR